MADTPNYNETSASGTCWQRACRVVIENPYQSQPSIIFVEEKIYTMSDGKVIKEPVANLMCSFNAEDPMHGAIYYYLNELYTVLRTARDTPPVTIPVEPPVEPPVTP